MVSWGGENHRVRAGEGTLARQIAPFPVAEGKLVKVSSLFDQVFGTGGSRFCSRVRRGQIRLAPREDPEKFPPQITEEDEHSNNPRSDQLEDDHPRSWVDVAE